ncbi:hypothetical protein CLIB1423_19S00496 [[Candida] railenensis]|uniref:FHA domain-containing protein n=1 Tax=[Candida] railenensis TaxID=45579 RepID=A0A9P0W0N2_9ASCO|nr:hypothetical protein CLIB1423_19S00496 [[Candida] railenensis]
MDIPISFDLGPTSSTQLGHTHNQNASSGPASSQSQNTVANKQSYSIPRSLANGNSLHSNGSAAAQSNSNNGGVGRKRSNSRSQVISSSSLPSASAAAAAASATVSGNGSSTSVSSITPAREYPDKRMQMQYIVTLIPLNETFIKKNLLIPYYPETLKLGRPAGSKIKPEINNGYFDSRVLSRNHAAMFIDPENGKLMIKDLGSSNGTFVNESKIGSDPIELKIGDIIYLGFNIEVDTSHKKISAKIENINMMPNYLRRASGSSIAGNGSNNGSNINANNTDSNSSKLSSNKRKLNASNGLTGTDLKHYNFIQSIFDSQSQSQSQQKHEQEQQGSLPNTPMSFENALFGDINPNLEDAMLGLNPKGGCGIFNNSQITNAANLEQTITILTNNLSKVRQQNSTLKSLEEFVKKYQSRLNEINQDYLDRSYKSKLQEYENKLEDVSNSQQKTKQEFDKYKIKKEQKVYQLEQQILKMKGEIDVLDSKVKANKLAMKKADEIEQSKKNIVKESSKEIAQQSPDLSKTSARSNEDGKDATNVHNGTSVLLDKPNNESKTSNITNNKKNNQIINENATAATTTTTSDNDTNTNELNENYENKNERKNENASTRSTFKDLLPPVSTPPTLELSAINAIGQSFLSTPPPVSTSLLPSPDIRDGIESSGIRDDDNDIIDSNSVDREKRNDSISVTPPVSDDEVDIIAANECDNHEAPESGNETKANKNDIREASESGIIEDKEQDSYPTRMLSSSDYKSPHQQELVPIRTIAFVGFSVVLLYFFVNYRPTVF